MPRRTETTEKAKAHAQDLAGKVKDTVTAEASARAESLKDSAAQEVESAAHAADAAADAFPDQSVQHQVLSRIADNMEAVAGQVRSADLAIMSRKVSDFARENPLLFVGSAALAGFAAARFLSARNTGAAQSASFGADPWDIDPSLLHGTSVDTSGHTSALARMNGGRDA
ncbi:hypothetical protein [Ruegeria sp. HKCCD6157]|uniref:hypothetical protein n=1 Tax=Ruegeria sp. HKCCD6157 TaxID=2690707 RepID=UPI001491DC6F|nr:hypothetical protein [Ruegeria sp. HKCCD6157]NOE28315.1 hypothetical protein [Ruegeria sp. HKCCD6157]